MSEVGKFWNRTITGILVYLLLVIVSAYAFSARNVELYNSNDSMIYALCGPAISLFTHMSYGLFLMQSVLLIPWVMLFTHSGHKWIAALGFVVTWFWIGIHMYKLF